MALPDFSMRQLLEAGVHFGHQTQRWNPRMGEFIYGERNGIHILDLTQTVPMLDQALQAVRETVAKGGSILFVGTKRQAQKPVAEAAERCAQYYMNHRWLGGTLTNWKTVSNSISRLKQIDEAMEGGLGGDINENNYEAVLKGIRACPDCEEIIMIADNYAIPRDLELLTGIKKPIRIILCGASNGINVDYLNLAKRNGGSIHTVEQDLTNLVKLNDGQTITIGKEKFVIRNGKFYKTKGS